MSTRAVDANILLRFLTADQPEMSARCRALLERVARGEERIFLPWAALADVVWTLRSFYRWPVERIAAFAGDLLALEGVEMERKERAWVALDLFANSKLDFSDALISAELMSLDRFEVYSFDRDFDRCEGLKRFEP